MPGLTWDLYCRVIDNLGDAGVCWRLAAQLGALGHRVRLVIDDAAPLAHLAPRGTAGVQVLSWPGPAMAGDVVIEAFGCDPPEATVAAMAARARPPVWINLEYLSAEDWVERSHGLPSPQRNGLTKWFFFPGFTARTGGLLREPGLQAQREAFDRDAWLQQRGLQRTPGERVVTLFCYANPALPALLAELSASPTLLLLPQGWPQRLVSSAPAGVRLAPLPWLEQPDFDHLLWAADLNFVRGEDSLVRAVWAGAPFVWQAYPQDDGVHAAKVDALLVRLQAPPEVRAAWQHWNGLAGAAPLTTLPATPFHAFRARLLAQDDLARQLLAFVETRNGTHPAC